MKSTELFRADKPAIANWKIAMLEKLPNRPLGIREQSDLLDFAESLPADFAHLKPFQVGMWVCFASFTLLLVYELFHDLSWQADWLKPGFALAGYLLYSRKEKISWRRKLSTALKQWSVRPKHCVECDYDLSGSANLQCPECGTELAPTEDTGQVSHS